jgi:DNA-directed RNA polymerase subunit H
MAKKNETKPIQHVLVPKHTKLSKKDADKLLEKYNISAKKLPHILRTDLAISDLEVEAGDIIEISRDSPTAGKIKYYRCVVDEQ